MRSEAGPHQFHGLWVEGSSGKQAENALDLAAGKGSKADGDLTTRSCGKRGTAVVRLGEVGSGGDQTERDCRLAVVRDCHNLGSAGGADVLGTEVQEGGRHSKAGLG